MSIPDPGQEDNKGVYEVYLSEAIGRHVELIEACPLRGGYRNTPWKLMIKAERQIESFVLRLNHPKLRLEYETLNAIQDIGPRTPRAWGLDTEGIHIGTPCFVMEFIPGEVLMKPLAEGAEWAEELYLETVVALQAIPIDKLGSLADEFGSCDALGFLNHTHSQFERMNCEDELVSAAYERLNETLPERIEPCFGNGDLSPFNFLVSDRTYCGVIDFEFPSICDPMFEFMSPIQWYDSLRNRGLEERYCRLRGFDPGMIDWYRALVLFATWQGVLDDPKSEFDGCTAASCRQALENRVSST